MNIIKSIKNLSLLEKVLWISSLVIILTSFCLISSDDWLTVIASLIGATALIFVGKGDAIGQLLTIVFSIIYAIISFQFHYYGEMITYLGMTAPSALIAMINWLRNPYTKREVKVNHLTLKTWLMLCLSAIVTTYLFYHILNICNTSNMVFSTISVTTSFLASSLTILRSPYYAVAYAANDIVLIILWGLATQDNVNYLPMIICFVIFLINDIYGYMNWQLMKRRQVPLEG